MSKEKLVSPELADEFITHMATMLKHHSVADLKDDTTLNFDNIQLSPELTAMVVAKSKELRCPCCGQWTGKKP